MINMREVFSKITEKHPTNLLTDRYGIKKSIRKLKAKKKLMININV